MIYKKSIKELKIICSSEVEGTTYYKDTKGNTYIGSFWNDDNSGYARRLKNENKQYR